MWRNLRSASGGPMGKNPVEGENSPFASGLLKIAIDLLGLGLDPCMDELLRETGETLGGDRCFSAFLSSDLDRIYGVREWCSAAAEAGSAAPLAAHHHPVLADELAQGRILQINDPAALPPDAAATRQACEERGLRSLVLAPLLHHGRLNGWIGVETLSEAMTWTETQLGLLGQVADLIAAGHQQEQRCNELHRLALAGERAKETTDRASRTKNEFMANMSHEIRTPVNAIVGIAHLVLQSELSERQRDQLRKIRASSQTLLGIINSILDFSKIDAGRMAIESFNFRLEDVLDNLQDLLETKARAKGLRLLVEVPEDVPGALVGDAFRLGQVLINLGDNAVKFTNSGEVKVLVELVDKDEDEARLRFSVHDTGIGLDETHLTRLFQPFTQIDGSTTRPFGGTGLGLVIANGLVEMMGGEITVSSRPGEGSEFSFTLTFPLQSARPDRPRLPHPDLKGMRILVADDSQTSRVVLCETLQSFTFSATAVESGEAALAALERAETEPDQQPFELVLIDWKMPTMDGLEASRRIKQHAQLEKVPPVILITGYGREDVILQADKAMLDGFLLKPINPSLLFDAIMTAIGREGTKGAAQEGAKQPTGQGNIPGGRVLVVEDNILNQEVATELIGDIGLEVVIADNGREALDIITEQHFDLILMDVQMPVMDGFEATAEIRSLPGFEKLPIVAMTAHAMSGDRERCLEAGMDDYISKPIDTDRLFEVLHKWAHTPTPAKPVEGSRVDDQGDVLPTDLAGINIEAGLARVGGNQLLFRKLLLQFLHDYRDVIETIRTALELGHRESGLRLLHTLKGVAATIGAERVHGAARELEAAVTAGTADDHARLLSALDRSLSPVLGSLTAMESESPKPQTDAGDGKTAELEVPDLEPLLRELKILLDEGDPEAAELLASCASRLTGSTASAQIRVLEQHIENFDFDDALVAASELATALGIKIERSGT